MFWGCPSTRGPTDKTVKGWRERGTWSAALTLRFDLVQLGSIGTPYRPCPVLRTRPKPFDPHFRGAAFPSGELSPRQQMKTGHHWTSCWPKWAFLLRWKASNFTLHKYYHQSRLGRFMHHLSRHEKGFWQKKNSIWNMFMKNRLWNHWSTNVSAVREFHTERPTCCLTLNNWKAAANHTLISEEQWRGLYISQVQMYNNTTKRATHTHGDDQNSLILVRIQNRKCSSGQRGLNECLLPPTCPEVMHHRCGNSCKHVLLYFSQKAVH